MRLFSIIFLFALSGTVSAFECNPDGNQAEMNQCALQDFEKADQKLNQTWQQLLKKSADNKAYITKIRAAQRAWIKFRDAELAAMFACESDNPRICWGSMYPMLYHGEMSDLTEQRTRRLQQYINDGPNPAVGE